jgi:hypothetical protein
MSGDWCDVMDMARPGCAHCRPAAQRQQFATFERELAGPPGHAPYDREVSRGSDFELGPLTVARQAGRCPVCKLGIVRGDSIRAAAPGWIHSECAP